MPKVDNKTKKDGIETKEFKAESKRLLDLMINSVYTNKEIFLRELISNSSDALDKLHFASLTDSSIDTKRDELCIMVQGDKKNRTLCVVDNGIGMTEEEMDVNLGTIAKSGSHAFRQRLDLQKVAGADDVDIIGQFGVGFYSAFMVADKVSVLSLVRGGDSAYLWESSGLEGYSITSVDKSKFASRLSKYNLSSPSGTLVELHLKSDQDNPDDFKFDDLIGEFMITSLVKKYSDYIRYPIQTMSITREKQGEEFVEKQDIKTINSQVPLWKKSKDKITKDEYDSFYREKFFDYTSPLKAISAKIEGSIDFDTLLYIPSAAPYDYFAKDFQKGVQLYAAGVLITEKCSELLPDYFGFVKGVVDSNDLSLNISREMLQQDHQLKKIATALEKKIRSELVKMQQDDRESYDKFFDVFGLTLKFGAYDQFGSNKDKLVDLLMFYSSTQKKLVSFKEYVANMKPNQEHIYYATGQSYEKLDKLPSSEQVRDMGYEILYLVDNVDEFCIKIIAEYDKHKFMSVASPELNLYKDDKNTSDANKHTDLLNAAFEVIKDKVTEVKLSTRLKKHAVCLSSKGEISIEMEKVLSAMPDKSKNIKAEKILELNPEHKIFAKMQQLKTQSPDDFAKVVRVLYTTARIVDGLSVEDGVEFAEELCDLI